MICRAVLALPIDLCLLARHRAGRLQSLAPSYTFKVRFRVGISPDHEPHSVTLRSFTPPRVPAQGDTQHSLNGSTAVSDTSSPVASELCTGCSTVALRSQHPVPGPGTLHPCETYSSLPHEDFATHGVGVDPGSPHDYFTVQNTSKGVSHNGNRWGSKAAAEGILRTTIGFSGLRAPRRRWNSGRWERA